MVWKKDKMKGSEHGSNEPDEARTDDGTNDGVAETETAPPTLGDLEGAIDVPDDVAAGVPAMSDAEPSAAGSSRRLEERIRTLSIQLGTARVREDELTGQVVELEGIVGDLRSRIDELEIEAGQVGPLTDQVASLTETLDKERRRSAELADARTELETEANRLSSQVAQLTELIDEARADSSAETARATDAEERLARLLESHESMAREHEEEIARLRTEVESAEAALETLRNEATERETHLETQIQQQSDALQEAEAEAERRVGEVRESMGQELEAAGAALTEHEALTAAAQQAAVEADERAAEAQQRAAEAQQAVADAERRAAEAQQAVADADERATDGERRAAEAQQAAADAQQAALEAQQAAAEAAARSAESEDRAARAEQEAASTGSELQAAQASLSNLESAHEALRMRTEDLRSEIERQTDGASDIDVVKGELAHAQAELDRMNGELAAARSENESVRRELEDVRTSEASAASEEMSNLRTERDQAVTEVEALRKRITELETRTVGEGQAVAADQPQGDPTAAGPSQDEADTAGLRETIADLEVRLDQAEMRARRAYAASEAAEAALTYEKERRMSLAPTVEAEEESHSLRQKVAELLDRVAVAEEATRKAHADLAAVRAGVEPKEPGEEIASGTEADEEPANEDAAGRSLRARLAGAASSRKGTSSDTDQWR
jgi:chromosome segregation ATPase